MFPTLFDFARAPSLYSPPLKLKSMKLSTIAFFCATSCLLAAATSAAAAAAIPPPLVLDLSNDEYHAGSSPPKKKNADESPGGAPPPPRGPRRGWERPPTATLVANRATVAMITWDSVRSTTIFAASLGLLCLLGYELFRRDPLVGKYVYDRKRLTQPDRSPPPLMISRSLWRGGGGGGGGGDDDDDVDDDPGGGCCSTAGRRCWPVCCPALLEMVFVTLDSDYIRYSRRADDARKSREMRGHVGCCRSGWFHRNCRSNYRGRSSSSTTADEDGYVFHPEYNGEYSHAYVPGYDDAGYSVGPNNETPVVEADNGAPSSSPEVRAVVEDEVVLTTTTTKRKNAYDLFPGKFII